MKNTIDLLEKLKKIPDLKEDFSLDNFGIFKLSAKEAFEESPLPSFLRLIFHPRIKENLEYIDSLNRAEILPKKEYLTKNEYKNFYKTEKGWTKNLTKAVADSNYKKQIDAEAREHLLTKKHFLNYISGGAGTIVGTLADPTNVMLSKLFNIKRPFFSNSLADEITKGAVNTATMSTLTSAFNLTEANISQTLKTLDYHINNIASSSLLGGAIPLAPYAFKTFKVDNVIKDVLSIFKKEKKITDNIEDNIKNDLKKNIIIDKSYNIKSINIENEIDCLKKINDSIVPESTLNKFIQLKKKTYNSFNNNDFLTHRQNSGLKYDIDESNSIYNKLTETEKNTFKQLDEQYNKIRQYIEGLKVINNDHSFSTEKYIIVKNDIDNNCLTKLDKVDKIINTQKIGYSDIEDLKIKLSKNIFDFKIKNAKSLIKDNETYINNNSHHFAKEELKKISSKQSVSKAISESKTNFVNKISIEIIKADLKKTYPKLKKYIDRTKNNNKIKSLLNNLSEYSDYHLIKVTDIIVKANNLKKKILEFKSDYIHGYTKIIEGTENKIANHAIKMRNNFSADISNANLTNYIKDSKNTLNIMKALYAESRMKFKNLSVLYKNIPNAAIECAKIIRRVQTAQLNFLKSSGKYIEPLDNYIIKQTHNKEKLLSAGKATWINDIKKHLNIKKTFKKKDISEESINKRLENIYHKLIQSEIDILRQDKFTYKKFLGLKRRSLHFKSPEDFYNYNKMYGNTPDIFDAAHSIIDSFARKRGITEDWGLDPVKVKKTIDDFLLKNADANLKKNFEKDLKNENLFSHNKMFKTLLGENSIPVSSSAAEFNASIRGIFTISRLQGFMASLPDLCTFVLIAKAMDVPAMRSISHLIKNFLNINSKKYKDFSKSIGIFSTHMTSELRSTFETTLKGNKKIMALNDLFFKINLQDFWDRTIRSSAGSLVALELNKIKYKKFNNINIYIKNAFKQNNIDKVDFKCLKYMSKDGLIDPSLYYNIPDKLVKKILKLYPLKGNDILEYKLKIKNNIEAFYFKSSTMLIPTQSQKTRIIATWGLPAGSVSGEAARYIMQFKSFPLIMITDFIENILNMSKPIEKQKGLNKIRKDILKQERSTYINLASLAVATTLVGYIVLCSSYICSGKEAPNLFEVSTLIQSIQRGGFFGLFGDIVQRYDQFSKPVSKLENPASQTVDKIATAISLLSEGESSKALETVKRLGWDNVPFKNISYIKYIYSTELINNISKILDKDFYLDKSHL